MFSVGDTICSIQNYKNLQKGFVIKKHDFHKNVVYIEPTHYKINYFPTKIEYWCHARIVLVEKKYKHYDFLNLNY